MLGHDALGCPHSESFRSTLRSERSHLVDPVAMRFLGTVSIDHSDGSVEKFKDRVDAEYSQSNNSYEWWTHTFEREWDDALVVTRHVISIDHSRGSPRSLWDAQTNYSHALSELSYEVARLAPGEWRRVRRKEPK
jgi:hypothetical protein